MTKSNIALVMFIPAIIGIISRVPLSILSGRINHEKFIPFTFLIQLIYLIAYFLIQDPLLFYPIIGFSALAWSGFGPAAITFTITITPNRVRGTILGWYYTMSGFGQFLGPLILSILLIYLSLRSIFLISVFFPIIGLICSIALWWREKKKDLFNYITKKNQDSSKILNIHNYQKSLSRIFSNRNLLFLFMCRTSFFFSLSIFDILFSLYLYEILKYSPALIGILFSLKAFMSLITRLPAGVLSDRIGRIYTYLITYIFISSGFILISLHTTPLIIGLGVALIGSGQGMAPPIGTAFLNDNVDDRDRSLALAVYLSNLEIGKIIASASISSFIKYTSTPTFFRTSAFILILAIFLFVLGIRKKY